MEIEKADAVDISPKQDGGVLKKIIQVGTGNSLPPPGSKVTVHYTGTLLDGTKFDSSRDRGEPFQFDLGQGSVIKAWDIGVAAMKLGERAMLICAPNYAYGERGSPPTIPPNSTLTFDVEVLGWKGEDLSSKGDGGIERVEILTPGEGSASPSDGAQVEVHLLGKFNDSVFEDRDVSFPLGEGSEFQIIPGVERAIEKLKKGEKSRIRIQPQYGFGNDGSKEYNIPSNASVEYIITLKSFEKAKESWSLDTEEKIEHSKMFKEKGTNYFKAGKYKMALKFYKKIHEYLDSEEMEGDVGKEVKSLKLASHLNAALCSLKLNDNLEARQAATKALEIDPNNEKAYFRRGQALLALEDAQLAANDFAECIRIDPNNAAAKTQQAICAKRIKEQLQKEKKLYANMFDRFAKMDAQREEIEKEKQPNVLSSVGEWGKEDREREPSEFEKENPNILLLNSTGEFRDM